MDYKLIIERIKHFVIDYFAANSKEQLMFHDISHTEKVVAATQQIASHYQLNEQDNFIVIAAAWFHDMGYCLSGAALMHEQKSAVQAEAFLKENGVDDDTIALIKGCILATKMPQKPTTLLQEIVCDADLFHLGTDDFTKRNKQMRKELEAIKNIHISKEEWRMGAIQLLQNHQYHTDYCKALLNDKKQRNLAKLLQKQQEETVAPVADQPQEEIANEKTFVKEAGIKSQEKPSRGIETMFRIAVTNHQRLSDMADSKANIMISVNAILISVVIGLVMRKLETTHVLIAPTLILLIGSVTTVIFSVLATRPKIPDGYFSSEQLTNKTVNLLFFGNFYKMDFDHYYEGMQRVMADSEFLYGSLIRDIHSQGKVLGQKYKLLRISYTLFMFTLIISILAYGVVAFILLR